MRIESSSGPFRRDWSPILGRFVPVERDNFFRILDEAMGGGSLVEGRPGTSLTDWTGHMPDRLRSDTSLNFKEGTRGEKEQHAKKAGSAERRRDMEPGWLLASEAEC
jgi:hypothetical protein